MRAVLRSERTRLTALYGALLLLAGGGLVALVNVLLRTGLQSRVSGAVTTVMPGLPVSPDGVTPLPSGRSFEPAHKLPPGTAPTPEQIAQWRVTQNLSDAAARAALQELTLVSLVALALFAVLSVWLAWWMAGRVLRPVAVITETARRLSGENLHERIGLQGPPGELKRLADTFDGMLDRIQDLVGAQRRFAANAAHELRTPLAVQRAAAEIGLAGEPEPAKVARIRERLIAVADSSEHLVESLLLLAVSEEGLESSRPVDLAALTAAELAAAVPSGEPPAGVPLPAPGARAGSEPVPAALTVVRDLAPLTVTGDATLLGHLVRNLLANAVRHNRPGGRVRVATSADGVLAVSNTGPLIGPGDVPRLLEPFRRRAERRHTAGEGAGLGLSIVASIARAHGARLLAEANPEPDGGLTVSVRFPAPHHEAPQTDVRGER
ncbi:ATP-binding protein [Streptomyces katrae]|uniref:histidine kinase n=1 Tax=Streptomyces katrae TaxID=68223 RepID=A0ABT7GSJ3_9ACTN|nr:ATP-binding protein [Streptomyces katrae]MDK9496565.1 ATP-binding protein [Streptomyces katrae]